MRHPLPYAAGVKPWVAGLQDRAEAKLATLEAAAEGARQEAAAHEKQWRLQQHERELARWATRHQAVSQPLTCMRCMHGRIDENGCRGFLTVCGQSNFGWRRNKLRAWDAFRRGPKLDMATHAVMSDA